MDFSYILSNYNELITDIRRICVNLNRNFDEIKLIAVSKTFPPEYVSELFKSGHPDFGENKVQELRNKFDNLRDLPVKWHLIGHLQTNKVKYIAEFVHLIQSVDSVKLAEEIEKNAKKYNRIIDVLVQVNTSREDQKSGVEIEYTGNLCNEISKMEHLNLKGLMTIGKLTDNKDIIRENFKTLRILFDEFKQVHKDFEYLSMGMTSDYEIALEEGANMLRIGSAIFGSRN